MTISTTCPQCGLTQETPADRICRGCANAISSLVAPARSMLGLGKEAAAKAHLRGHAKTMDLEYYRGVFADKNHGYQVVAFATPQSFARVEPELAAMVRSFQPDCAAGSKSP